VTCCGGTVAGTRLLEDGVNNTETCRRKNLSVKKTRCIARHLVDKMMVYETRVNTKLKNL
jgi:hypothetical protein